MGRYGCGKAAHHCTVIDADGKRRLSRRVANDETELLKLIAEVLELTDGEPVTWAIDLNAGRAALMIALLTNNGQQVLYIPGRSVHHASGSYRGDGKSDAKDAFVIADRLAGVAGLAPVPKDSGRISGNMRRPRRYCRRLLRVFYMSAMVAARHCPVSKAFDERKRAEGKGHRQAIIALARRRLNVLWALGGHQGPVGRFRCHAGVSLGGRAGGWMRCGRDAGAPVAVRAPGPARVPLPDGAAV